MKRITFLTENFNSDLYCYLEIWKLPKLPPDLKKLLISASANNLTVLHYNPDQIQNHSLAFSTCAVPDQMIEYKHVIFVHKMQNNKLPDMNCITMNFQQDFLIVAIQMGQILSLFVSRHIFPHS